MNVRDAFYEVLRAHGITTIFGNPGSNVLATSAPAGPVYLSLPLDDWDIDADASALEQLKARAVHGDPVVPGGRWS